MNARSKVVFEERWLKEIEKLQELNIDIDYEEVFETIEALSKSGKTRRRTRGEIVATVVYALLKRKYGVVSNEIARRLIQTYNTNIKTILSLKRRLFPEKGIMDWLQIAKEIGKKKFNVREDEVEFMHKTSPITSLGDAAAIVYILSKKDSKDVTEEEVAEAFGITVVTLRNHLRKIKCAFAGCDVRASQLAKELKEILAEGEVNHDTEFNG